MIINVTTSQPLNHQQNQTDTVGVPKNIASAIQTAANQTGVDFSYLLKKAAAESSYNANAKASTSSATGLYQFTQQTWLHMMKNYGGKYGLGNYADHIQMDSSGIAHVDDPKWRQAILNLRKNPVASAEMAGELDKENQATLEDKVDGKIGATELYLAHFLGAGGASRFLNKMQQNPNQTAANILPDAADSNPHIFYSKDGTPRSLKQIYQHFAQKFDGVPSGTMVASASPDSSTSSTLSSNAAFTLASTSPMLSNFIGSPTGNSGVRATSLAAVSSATNSLKVQDSALFAAMVLAQAHDNRLAETSDNEENQHNKKTQTDLLDLAAVG